MEVSRLSRSTQQLCEILDIVKNKHLRLVIVGSITVDCRKGKIDPMSQAFIQMSGVFAELELSMIRERVRSGMENAKAKGKRVIFVANLPAAQKNEVDGEIFYRILHMDDINAIYKHAAEKAGFALISMYDLVSAFVAKKGILVDDLLVDGLHPSDEGYKVMFSLLCEALGA
jgi:DNA invertase Pin-like site-specific DNA recombinase